MATQLSIFKQLSQWVTKQNRLEYGVNHLPKGFIKMKDDLIHPHP